MLLTVLSILFLEEHGWMKGHKKRKETMILFQLGNMASGGEGEGKKA